MITIFDGPNVVAEFKTKKAAEKFAKRVMAPNVAVIRGQSRYDFLCTKPVYQVIAYEEN